MADYPNAALPVFTPGDSNQQVQVKLYDASTPTQGASVDVSGNLSANIKYSAATPDTGNGAVGASTTLRVTLASDSTGQVKLATGSNTIGQLTANQSVNISQLNGTTTDTNNGTVSAGTLRVTLASDSTGQVKLATGSSTIGTVNIGTTGGLALDSTLSALSAKLPAVLGQTTKANSLSVVLASDQTAIPVIVTSAALGTPVDAYNTSASVAAAGTVTHAYTVTAGKTLTLGQVHVAASGKMKATIQVDLGAGLVTKFVKFNSVANPSIELDLDNNGIAVAATKQVAIVIVNSDNQPQDVYSTIVGVEN